MVHYIGFYVYHRSYQVLTVVSRNSSAYVWGTAKNKLLYYDRGMAHCGRNIDELTDLPQLGVYPV